jgi:hypothetical protein
VTYMLLIYQPDPPQDAPPAAMEGMFQAYTAYTERVRASGAFVDASPLVAPSSATTVRVRDGKRLITDGPFAETKEWLGGYYVIECDSLDRALDLAADCPGASYGSIEIRPVMDISG